MHRPNFTDLEPEYRRFVDPANAKAIDLLARGVAPLPPQVLIPCWMYLLDDDQVEIKEATAKSISAFPLASMKSILQSKIPAWALYRAGKFFEKQEELLEVILLNEESPNTLVVEVSATCSERLVNIIANNQERIIESPEVIVEIEKNPLNLKSTTDRLRQFLRLAGIFVPGKVDEAAKKADQDAADAQVKKTEEEQKKTFEELAETEDLSDEKRVSLLKHIATLSTGAKVKLSTKGNKEARNILIKDANKSVSVAVLKNPRITENEVIHYSNLKSLSDDVVRIIATNPTWTKNYNIKLNLINHPKTPLPVAMQFIKFLNLRDLQGVSKSKTVAGPVRKSAKELLTLKRK